MLAIRMQRTGRKGHAQFRVIVQEARLAPTSGRIVARLGHHNPHTKTTTLDKEKAAFYLEHGARPSERVVRVLQAEGVKLPKWVTPTSTKQRAVRHSEKLRKNQPQKPAEEAPAAEPKAEETAEPAKTEVAEPAKADKEEKPATKEAAKDEDK